MKKCYDPEMSMILSLSIQSFQLENPIRQHYLNVVLPRS